MASRIRLWPSRPLMIWPLATFPALWLTLPTVPTTTPANPHPVYWSQKLYSCLHASFCIPPASNILSPLPYKMPLL